MRKGFIYSFDRCVNCSACRAACTLENGWDYQPRVVYTYNSEVLSSVAFGNLSLACNHCQTAACLNGCPSSAYKRDPDTGAILVDEENCIGCKYCLWNCPYEAPKFDPAKHVIGKCNLCYSLLIEGGSPACASACPTGALRYGEIPEHPENSLINWFPDKGLNPAIEFTGNKKLVPLKVFPDSISVQPIPQAYDKKNLKDGIWSLVAFSFISTISVSLILASFIKGIFPPVNIFIPLIIIAGLVSLFHLGKPLRAWKSVRNFRNSALSREIAFFITYAVVSIPAVFFKIPWLMIASSLIGLIFLISIDSVYINSDRRKYVLMHSGQTFLSCLIIVSFFSGIVFPFVFIAVIKLILLVNALIVNKITDRYFGLRFLRIAFLLIPAIAMVSELYQVDIILYVMFIAGEFIDRILFYLDYNPLQISTEIIRKLNIEVYETKRG